MLLVPTPMLMASGGIVFPAVTINRADIGGLGLFYGYVRPGGPTSAQAGGLSGGTLSATLVPGFVTDAVTSSNGGSGVVIMGDCAALLSGVTALMDNGTPIPFSGPAYYDSENGTTNLDAEGGIWSSTGNRTIQLV